jgi:hypothetical protein
MILQLINFVSGETLVLKKGRQQNMYIYKGTTKMNVMQKTIMIISIFFIK